MSLEQIVEMEKEIVDTNVESYDDLPSPNQVLGEIPISDRAREVVRVGRRAIKDILDYKDKRKIVIVGPCSVHDTNSIREYASNLAKLSDEVKDQILIVMRTYLEKPRSTIGWKGIIDDPDLDDSNHTEKGIRVSRQLLLDINELGLPCANEFLREDLPQYVADLISWGAIGARNVESQTHRELASGLSMPIGFKNNTSGDIRAAVDASLAARYSHVFLGITPEGKISRVKTRGNPYSHIVLRGGNGQPNYHPEKIVETKNLISKA